jgi:hypothetical protein
MYLFAWLQPVRPVSSVDLRLWQVKPALWTAILQPQASADDIEQFRDAADDAEPPLAAEPQQQQQQQLRAAPDQADSPDSAADVPDVDAVDAAQQPIVQLGDHAEPVSSPQPSGEAPWPAPGAYDMHKRYALA